MLSAHLSDIARFDRVSNAVTVAATAINGATIDMAAGEGYDSVLFLVLWGAITDGTPNVKVQQGAASNLSDAADLADTDTEAAIADDNLMTIVDVKRPLERYVRCVVTRGGDTGAVVDAIVAILYDSKALPVTQSDDVAAHGKFVSPAEGTA